VILSDQTKGILKELEIDPTGLTPALCLERVYQKSTNIRKTYFIFLELASLDENIPPFGVFDEEGWFKW
jgi:hypothetical protein